MSSSKKRYGVLCVNLGTPESLQVSDVKRYLAEFLGDKRVVDLPYVLRKGLLYGVILRTRPKKTAHAYAQVWDKKRGSPLRYHSQDLVDGLQRALGDDYTVALAMRYGTPDLISTFERLIAECENVVVLPLFPQYASATTGSVLAKIYAHCAKKTWVPAVTTINDFHRDEGFIDCYADKLRAEMNKGSFDRVLMSFHSLPMRQVEQCKEACYETQCLDTARLIAEKADLPTYRYHVVFQSRLGRIPWLGPDLNTVLPALAEQGDKRIIIACPSFVADCLETLEEIQIRAKETWLALGGETVRVVPCLNADPQWISALKQMVLKVAPSPQASDLPLWSATTLGCA